MATSEGNWWPANISGGGGVGNPPEDEEDSRREWEEPFMGEAGGRSDSDDALDDEELEGRWTPSECREPISHSVLGLGGGGRSASPSTLVVSTVSKAPTELEFAIAV